LDYELPNDLATPKRTKSLFGWVKKNEGIEKYEEKMEDGLIFCLSLVEWKNGRKKRKDDYFISQPTIFNLSKIRRK
jgi:hypothetical protein